MSAAREITYTDALLEATRQAMKADPSVAVLGIGVADHLGCYGSTKGLVDEFGPDRVIESPLAEEGMTGIAIGMALSGMRPVHVHARMDFLPLCANQLVNMAAKIRFKSNEKVSVPLVVRAVIGKSWGQSCQHSQGLHAMFANIPGMSVIAPVTPHEAKGMMTWALRQRDPVLVVEHRLLYKRKGPVPEEPYVLAPCTAGDAAVDAAEITLVGVSQAAVECEVAAKRLAEEGIRADVLRVLGLSPMDAGPILESARRTHRVVIADTAWTSCGVSAEIAARIAEAGVVAQVKRLGFQPTPCPTAKRLENEFYKDTTAAGIAEAAFSMVRTTGEFRARLSAETGFKGPF